MYDGLSVTLIKGTTNAMVISGEDPKNVSIVNDQGAFADWCYSRPPTCKEGNGIQCFANLPSAQNVSGGPGNTE